MTRRTPLLCFLCAAALALTAPPRARGQAENVPVTEPVYTFLKRMEVRGLIDRYRDAVLPLSRREVAGFLSALDARRGDLSPAERELLARYMDDFRYEITRGTDGMNSLIGSETPGTTTGFGAFFADRPKYLYAYRDTNLTFFVNGLLTFDARGISGDALGRTHAEFLQGGGLIRGTVYDRIGYSLQALNSQFWGSRGLLERDPAIAQSEA
ncbi:MAG TPA: hypothetical protein VML00_00790, partial [Bacteroidota bacterium]|nr:hypothetical protein [Bacteroidota bacterium]